MEARELHNRVAPAEPLSYDGVNGRSDSRSLPDLLRELSADGRTLVRQEVELAKAEMSEKLQVYTKNMATIGVGGPLLLLAAMAGGTALIYGLIVLFDLFLPFEIAVWLAPLVLGAVLAVVGLGMIRKGQQAMADEGLAPQRTIETLREDKDWVKRKVR